MGSIYERQIRPVTTGGGPPPPPGTGSLQDAYDNGRTILTTALGSVLFNDGPLNAEEQTLRVLQSRELDDHNAVLIRRNPPGVDPFVDIYSGFALQVESNEFSASGAIRAEHYGEYGEAVAIESYANSLALSVISSSPGNDNTCLLVNHLGDGVALDITANTGPAIQAVGGGRLRLLVNNAAVIVGTDAAGAEIPLIGYGDVRLGNGASTLMKSFGAFTTTAPSPLIFNFGRLFWRASPLGGGAADTFIRGGNGGEVQVTKESRLNAEYTLLELPIENGQTILIGEGVAVASAGRCRRSNAISGFLATNVLGVCIRGGIGNLLGTATALIATSSQASLLVGAFAPDRPVYLSTVTAGILTTTVPTGTGNVSLRIGFSYSTTQMIIHVGEAVVL